MNARRKRFLFATWGTAGTLPPELTVARRLVERGHEVRVIGDAAARDEVLRAGCAFCSWPLPHPPNAEVRGLLGRVRRRSGRAVKLLRFGPLFGYAEDLLPLLFDPSLAYAETLLAELSTHAADGLVVDAMLFGAMAAAEKTGLPTALLLPNVYIMPAPGLPPAGPGLMPARGARDRLRDAIVGKVLDRAYRGALPELNATRAKLGLQPLEHPFDQLDRAARLLVLTSAAFDFRAERLPPNLRYVGPQLDHPVWAEECELPWPQDHPDPLVVVSFSTGFQSQERLLRTVINALGAMRVRALVTVGPAMASVRFDAADNVAVRVSVPHDRVFPLASAVVTHCGHGTVMRALAAGVPLVCLPMGRDQNDTAARVVARGAGVRLSKNASAASVRAAVERVLGDARFRDAATCLAATIARDEGSSRVVQEIESLVGIGVA